MKSQSLFAQIQYHINTHILSVSQVNKLNLNDKAVFLEDLFGRIFNVLTGKNFINLNDDVANVGSVDLWDERNLSVLQVTTQSGKFKSKKDGTIKGFLANKQYDGFESLQILFMGPKPVAGEHLKKVKIRSGCNYEGLDVTKLLGRIKIVAPEAKQKILDLLLAEQPNYGVTPKQAPKIDLVDLRGKINAGIDQFVQNKYFSNTHKSHAPIINERKVKRHNREVKVAESDLNTTNLDRVKHMEVIVGDFASLVRANQPTFLFGELGSGKSTIVAKYIRNENSLSNSINIFIPCNFVKGRIGDSADTVLKIVSDYLRAEIIVPGDLDVNILLQRHQVTLAFDGLDELSQIEARALIQHLQTVNNTNSNFTIIASGRPIELTKLVHFQEWNCLSVIDLSAQEIVQLLINEAKAAGINEFEAKSDADKRFAFLKLRADLMALAVTPLVVTLIRDYLTVDSVDLSLGDLLYKVLKERLHWVSTTHEKDKNRFITEYPHVYQREKFIAAIAQAIALSEYKLISDEHLFRIVDGMVPQELAARTKVVSDGIEFAKKAFLQQMGNDYSFISQPLFDTCFAIYIADNFGEITADADYIEAHWRAISGAAAIIRARGEVNKAKTWFGGLLNTFLNKPERTAAAAVIVQEFRDRDLAGLYVDLLQKLNYRPLRLWSDKYGDWDEPDTFSPVAIANALVIAEDKGFNWFFDVYLDLRHYTHMNETGQNANILLYYLIKRKFCLAKDQLDKLRSLVPYHLYYATFSCSNFVPVLALVIPDSLPVRERHMSFVMTLTRFPASDRARALIDASLANGNKRMVIDAIESLVKEGTYQKNEILRLWYELNTSSGMNLQVLNATIKVLLNEDEQLKSQVFAKIGEVNFIKYLKYSALEDGEDADEAAILYHELTNSVDFYLVCRPIMLASKWHHGNEQRRKQIMNRVIAEDKRRFSKLIAEHLLIRKGEAPLLGFIYFIKSLLVLDHDYTDQFKRSVSFLPKYCLTRNPELRDDIRQLLATKPIYRSAIAELATHIDSSSRSNAIKVIIACVPDDALTDLENYISGLLQIHALGDEEWLNFLYKLNFGKPILEHIHSKLDSFNILGKSLGLTLLYHHNYHLNDAEVYEMVCGLVGKGRFLCSTERKEKPSNIFEDERLVPHLVRALYELDGDGYDNVASILESYHMHRLSMPDKLYVVGLVLQRNHLYFFEFDRKYPEVLGREIDPDLFQSVVDKIRDKFNLQETFLEICSKALSGDQNSWIALFEKMLYERDHYQEYILFHFYRWAMENRKIKGDLTRIAGDAAYALSDYPAIVQKNGRGSPLLHLFIVADEFSSVSKERFLEVFKTAFEIKEDLLAVAAYRLRVELAIEGKSRFGAVSHMPLFETNDSATLPRITREQAEKWLFQTEDLPANFSLYLKSIIVYDVFNGATAAVAKSHISTLVYAILEFINSGSTTVEQIVDSIEIIEVFRSGKDFEEIIHLLKEIYLSRPGAKAAFITAVEKKIATNRKIFLAELTPYFLELFSFDEPLNFDLFKVLLDELMDRSYLSDLILLNRIAYYTAEIMPADQFERLAKVLRVYVNSMVNNSDKDHINDYMQLCWLFSIMLLLVEGSNSTIAQIGFLKGLKTVFIQNSRRAYRSGDDRFIEFKGRDLLLNAEVLLRKIPQATIDEILQAGLKIDMPEISSLCRFFLAFSSAGPVAY